MVGRKLRRIKIRAKKLKGIPRIKLKKIGRPFARDVKGALKVGKKIAGERIGGIKRKSKRRRK